MTDMPSASEQVVVTTPSDSVIKKPPNWFISRLAEPTSKAAIISVGMAYVAIIQAAIMGLPLRFLVAAAVPVTFFGIIAFAYKESPNQVRIEAAQQVQNNGITVNTAGQPAQ